MFSLLCAVSRKRLSEGLDCLSQPRVTAQRRYSDLYRKAQNGDAAAQFFLGYRLIWRKIRRQWRVVLHSRRLGLRSRADCIGFHVFNQAVAFPRDFAKAFKLKWWSRAGASRVGKINRSYANGRAAMLVEVAQLSDMLHRLPFAAPQPDRHSPAKSGPDSLWDSISPLS